MGKLLGSIIVAITRELKECKIKIISLQAPASG